VVAAVIAGGVTGVVLAVASSVAPAGWTAYVVDQMRNTVTPISLSTGTPGAPIATGNRPIAITPNVATAYVLNASGKENALTPIDLATDTVGRPVAVGSGPMSITITPDGSTAYVADEFGGDVTVVKVAIRTADRTFAVCVTNEWISTVTLINLASHASRLVIVGVQPVAIALAPATSWRG
jgi:DNA-binding beta-propeller fold protein YncE